MRSGWSAIRRTTSSSVRASLFQLPTHLAFWALRSRDAPLTRQLARLVDIVFPVALTALVGKGSMMVCALC